MTTDHHASRGRTVLGLARATLIGTVLCYAWAHSASPAQEAPQSQRSTTPRPSIPILRSLCLPHTGHASYAPAPGRSILESRIRRDGVSIAECTGDDAVCEAPLHAQRGRFDVELRCDDWTWRARVELTGNEVAFSASGRFGRPVLVLRAPARGLRLSLAEPGDGIATLPGRPRALILVNEGDTAVTASARLQRWNGSWWWDLSMEASPMPGHLPPPPPALIPAHDRGHVPLSPEEALERRDRYRIVAEARTTESVDQLTVHRSAELTLELDGRELLE